MECGQMAELPMATDQLATHYQLGQPLAFYTMYPRAVRLSYFYRWVLLGIVICMVLLLLVVGAIFLYQYLTGLPSSDEDLPTRAVLILSSIFMGLFSCFELMFVRYTMAQSVPASLLICTEGLLVIRPKEVDTTRWDEVNGALQRTGRKRYKLNRMNRKFLLFSEAYEDLEGLVNLIRQHTPKRNAMS